MSSIENISEDLEFQQLLDKTIAAVNKKASVGEKEASHIRAACTTIINKAASSICNADTDTLTSDDFRNMQAIKEAIIILGGL